MNTSKDTNETTKYGVYGTKAQTWVEAKDIVIPPIKGYRDWHELARLINGYAIGDESGIIFKKWGHEQHQQYHQNGNWKLSKRELMKMLFYYWRQEHMVDGSTHCDEIDSILHELARLTGQKH